MMLCYSYQSIGCPKSSWQLSSKFESIKRTKHFIIINNRIIKVALIILFNKVNTLFHTFAIYWCTFFATVSVIYETNNAYDLLDFL
jgi:hypothetical protein